MKRRIFDSGEATEYVESFMAAARMTGYVCSADEEQAASEAFMAWAQSIGLRGMFLRTLANSGRVIWVLKLDAGRGRYEATTEDPRCWYAAIEHLGLPLDTVPAEWVAWSVVHA